MVEPKIRISVKEFCPQMTLPCEKETTYPDPYSCLHYYYCDKHGEIRRYTCGTSWVRINDGAALCGARESSTCDATRPRRQCDSVKRYLPNEYCEVLAPGRATWTYPDPERCQGYYKYSPPDLMRNDNDLVVERLSCPRGTYYSPSGEMCIPEKGNPDALCGGKWIYQSEDCRMIKVYSSDGGDDGQLNPNENDINTSTPNIPRTTEAAGNASIPSVPSPIVPQNGLAVLTWVVGLAAALVLLISILTLIFFMLQKRRRKRRLQNRSFNLPESSGPHGMDISRPMSFAELNEYAAIDDVFGNTLERSRLDQPGACSADSHAGNRTDGEETTSNRAVPDGYGLSRAPRLPPRPKSTPSYSNPERTDLKPHKSVGCCANQALSNDILCKTNENKKGFCNINWQTALNASMPDEFYSSDEYEAISFSPPATPEPPPDGSVKGRDGECNGKTDNQEYMIPVITHANVEVPKNDSFTKPCILPARRTQSLPHKQPRRIPSLISKDHTKDLISDIAVLDTRKDESVGIVGNYNSNIDSTMSSVTRDESCQTEEKPKKNYEQTYNPENDNYAWNISDSWIRCDKKEKTAISAIPSCDLDETPGKERHLSLAESIDVDGKDNTSNDIVDNVINNEETLNSVCISTVCAPDAESETYITDTDEPSTDVESINVENTKPADKREDNCSSDNEEGIECQSNMVSKPHPLGYEILVTASSPTDFRVYQYISADSESSSSSDGDLESIPGIQLSLVAGQGSAKHHEYYVLDKHHSSDTSVESPRDRRTRNLTVFEPKQRQSCKF